jgi:MFS family permease
MQKYWESNLTAGASDLATAAPIVLIGYAIYGIVFGICCSWLAIQKGRSGSNWFYVGFLLGIIGLLLIAFAPSAPIATSSRAKRHSAAKPDNRFREALAGFLITYFVAGVFVGMLFPVRNTDSSAPTMQLITTLLICVLVARKIYTRGDK